MSVPPRVQARSAAKRSNHGSEDSAAKTLARATSERELQDAVMELAELYNWRIIHFRPARTLHGWRTALQGSHAKGWPDCFALRGERKLVAELKREGESPDDDQNAWLDAFMAIGFEVHIWRPSDLPQILEILK